MTMVSFNEFNYLFRSFFLSPSQLIESFQTSLYNLIGEREAPFYNWAILRLRPRKPIFLFFFFKKASGENNLHQVPYFLYSYFCAISYKLWIGLRTFRPRRVFSSPASVLGIIRFISRLHKMRAFPQLNSIKSKTNCRTF